WRSPGVMSQSFTAIFPARQVAGIALSHHNLTAGAVIDVTLKNATTTVEEFTIDANTTDTWAAWITAAEADECHIEITDTDNPAGYLEIVTAYGGPAVSAQCNFEKGARVTWKKDTQHKYTAGQSLRSWGTGIVRR